MSKVKIQGNASGTGTFTISAPNSNTDRSLTLPDGAGEILLSDGDGSSLTGLPTSYTDVAGSFVGVSVYDYSNSTSIGNGSWTKVPLRTKQFDPQSDFDNTTNYRYTPSVAGWYEVSGTIRFKFTSQYGNEFQAALYHNGSLQQMTQYQIPGNLWNSTLPFGSWVVYCDGIDDYLELYAISYQGGGGYVNDAAADNRTNFLAKLLYPE